MNLILGSLFALIGFLLCYAMIYIKDQYKLKKYRVKKVKEFNEYFDFVTDDKWIKPTKGNRVYIPSKDESRVLQGEDESYFTDLTNK